jgi:hypothetical protein
MLTLDISMSLDGFVAGPNQTLETPLGEGGERLHEWAFAVAGFREQHGLSGGGDQCRQRCGGGGAGQSRSDADGQAHVQRRGGPVGRRPERGRLVGGRPAISPPGDRAHPPRSGAGDKGGRNHLHVRHSGHRGCTRAGPGGGGRQGRGGGGGANVAQQYPRPTSPAPQPLRDIWVDLRIRRRLVVVDSVFQMRWLRIGAVELVRRVRYVAVRQAIAHAGPA